MAHSNFQSFSRSAAHDGEKKGGKPIKAPTAGADRKNKYYSRPIEGQEEKALSLQAMLYNLEREKIRFYHSEMVPLIEYRTLSLQDRLQLVEAIWDSIAEDQYTLPDSADTIKVVRERKARYLAKPDSGTPWDIAKERIRDGRA